MALPAAAVTAKDEDDLRFGLALGVDLVALSFVQTPDDCHAARRIMRAARADVPLIAKIERPQALEHLDEILAAADGVMVARGDLGLECPLEQVPRIQKTIIARARALGRPVIVATQVLESMRTEPRPTRAEVSDAATAVDQGVDAIMLSGETAAGDYPVEAVETLSAIIRDAETVATPARAARPDISLSDRRHRAAARRLRRVPHRPRPRDVRGGGHAGVDRPGRGDRRRHAARQDGAAAVVAAPRAPASSRSRRRTRSRGG